MKLTHAFLGLSAVGAFTFGVVVPASSAHKDAGAVSPRPAAHATPSPSASAAQPTP